MFQREGCKNIPRPFLVQLTNSNYKNKKGEIISHPLPFNANCYGFWLNPSVMRSVCDLGTIYYLFLSNVIQYVNGYLIDIVIKFCFNRKCLF